MIYLDNNATTKLDPAVFEAMRPFLTDSYANPSSPYSFARQAALAIEKAREQVALLVGATPAEIHFTSGGTESNNAALESAAREDRPVIATAVEHASVRSTALRFAKRTGKGRLWPVQADGHPASDFALPRGSCAAVMWANNETGVLNDIPSLAREVHAQEGLLHVDAVQAAGKVAINLASAGVDTAALSAHKLHGPKGIGALFVRKGLRFNALLAGGDQEQGFRAGTENVAGIVGFGLAAELAGRQLGELTGRIRALRDQLEAELLSRVSGLVIAGAAAPRLPNTSMLVIPGAETEAVLALLDMDGICVSSGSACAAGAHEPSHVLRAMGLPVGPRVATIRTSLSRFTTAEDVAALVERLPVALQRAAG